MRKTPSLLIVVVLWFAGLCAAAQFAKVGLFIPELGQLYPSAGSVLGFILSAISVVGALLGLFAGSLALRVGLRRLLIGGLVLGAVISLVQSLGLSLHMLLASRVIEGVAHLAIVVSAPTLIALNSTEKMRATAMTLWGTFFGVSFAITAWLGLPVVATYGIETLFLAHGLVTGLIAALVLVVVPSQGLGLAGNDFERVSFSLREIVRQHVRTWTSPAMSAPAIGWLFYTVTFVALLAVLPGLMRAEERTFTATFLPIASIISSMSLGVMLVKNYSAVSVVCIGFALAIIVASTMPFLPGEPIPSIALFAALGLVQGASFAAVPELNKSAGDQALANGAFAQAGNIGNACGTPLLLLLLSVGGFGAMMVLVVACYVAAMLAHLWLARRRRIAVWITGI